MINLANAISAHNQWKIKLRNAMSADDTLDVETISKDNCCELGKWLHGEGKQAHGDLQLFCDCIKQHAVFHTEAGKVALLINNRRYQEAEDQIDYTSSAFGQASTSVINTINKLKRELEGG
jgi:Chemoreceptor zinc-binding domain